VPAVVATWPVLLTGLYAVNKRKEKIAAREKADAVAAAEAKAREEMKEKMAAAAEKAKKEKEAAVKREVKKALEAAARETESGGKDKDEEGSR